jgi:hypothetical protein
LNINCDDDTTLLDFISELIDQIEVVGIDQYRAIIELSFDEHNVDSGFIQKNISGLCFNALYFISDEYETIVDLISDDELCNSDEVREKIIAKFFGSEFSGLSSTYNVRNLICEIIGGGQLAIEVYKEEHGLNVIQGDIDDESLPEVVALVSSLPDIHAHTFLDGHYSDESKRNYLLLLALCVENSASLNETAREFIALLEEKSGIPDLLKETLELADNPRKHNEYQPIMQSLLDDDDKKYTWLLDAFFLLNIAQAGIENPKIKMILGILKPNQLKEYLPKMLVIVNENDDSLVLNAALKLTTHTHGWKNIVQYRRLHFDQYFADTLNRLNSVSWEVTRLTLDMSVVYAKGMENSVFFSFSDGSFLSNLKDKAAASLCAQGRKSAISSLNELRKRVLDYISGNRSMLSQANSMISRWNIPSFDFKDMIGHTDFDLDNSADNEEWGDQFEHYYRQIDDTLSSFSQACDDAIAQLELFAKGNFDQSVLKLREQKRSEYLRQQQMEKLEKQSITITKNGNEHLFRIEWQQIDHPPCDPEKISHIKTDGKVWLIVAGGISDEKFYRSEDGEHWQQVQLDTQDIKIWFDGVDVINGMWIIKNRALAKGTRDEGFYYSSDAITWRHSPQPEPSKRELSINEGCMCFGNIIYFNGLWLWCGHHYQKYHYTELLSKPDETFHRITY